ncbi:MAG: hypothetical protein ABR514_02470 [Chthoniobacterales bacterium]
MSRAVHLFILALIATSMAQAADDLPKRPDFARYDTMLQRSPFAIASAVAAPAATPNFARDLYVANAGHSSEGDFVTIASTSDKDFKEYLTTKAPVDGYSIASIEWSEKVGATKVTISKDGQFATISFNEALLSQQPPAGPQPPQQPQPGRPITAPGRAVPVPTPAIPGPAPARTPHVRGTIQRYPTPSTRPPTVATPRGRP